ncbi:site-specific DNA-methyltransferase [Nanchangia anserum]|uniref:site-specific DNA-methyltransferase n=1 Tax=Nanchangia anserum TaxID=2692125 RepID=UPI0030B83899
MRRGGGTPKQDGVVYSERADLEPQNDNLLILGESGDVLEALTRVPELAEKYVGKVKLVYIDPPFNTAQTFAHYEDNLEHSIWLTMMRDRLLHLKNLLAEDGSIWVHLDHVENHRMRLLMDEVFGAVNFIGEVSWEKTYSPRNDAKGLSERTDQIIVYGKSESFGVNRLPRTAEMNARYSNPDGSRCGVWKSGDVSAPNNLSGKRQVPALFGIEHPLTGELVYPARGAQWRFKQQRVLAALKEYASYELVAPDLELRAKHSGLSLSELRDDVCDLRIPPDQVAAAHEQTLARIAEGDWPEFYVKDTSFGRKIYAAEAAGRTPENLWLHEEVGHTDGAKKEIQALFPGTTAFSTPKPERLLERIIHIGSDPGDIVLDVFAGSGTTAAVAQKMGRRWVTCELLESTFMTFTRPRLEKVINDEDPGGITRTKGERVAAAGVELPAGVSPDDAAAFTRVLNKLITNDPEAKKDPRVKALKAAAKTARGADVINWRGGGGFQIAHLSPACFDYDPALDRVLLTADATGDALVASVAANLGFTLSHPDDDYLFDGRRGNALLKVVDGIATTDIVDSLASEIQPGETIVLAATAVMDGVRHHLRQAVKGSRVVAIPDDVFRYTQGGDQ